KAREMLRHYVTNEIPYYPRDTVDFATWNEPVLLDMQALCDAYPLNRADFFAVDGTPATPHLRYSSMQMVAVAVMGLSYATLHRPETFLTRSLPTSTLPLSEDITNKEAFLQWVGELDVTESNQSWPTTFREYVEREYAIRTAPPFVIIDGPLITQNLLT